MLIAGVISIKNKNMIAHKRFMTTAILLSILFLVSYVSFHLTSETTTYGGEGISKGIYYFILISHILLSIAIVPLVLITYVRALAERFDKHKKIARVTFPLWLYVTITGVLVYIMISPYYAFNA
jgi:putative membrane protein